MTEEKKLSWILLIKGLTSDISTSDLWVLKL